MILGIGNDLVDIRRIEKALARYGARFKDRCFTTAEQLYADAQTDAAAAYAKRFAAKEACVKALGSGFGNGLYFHHIGVINDENGRPLLELKGPAQKRLDFIMLPGRKPALHLSLTDEPPYAQAFVVIETIPEQTDQ